MRQNLGFFAGTHLKEPLILNLKVNRIKKGDEI
jgi:hypothetical protein